MAPISRSQAIDLHRGMNLTRFEIWSSDLVGLEIACMYRATDDDGINRLHFNARFRQSIADKRRVAYEDYLLTPLVTTPVLSMGTPPAATAALLTLLPLIPFRIKLSAGCLE